MTSILPSKDCSDSDSRSVVFFAWSPTESTKSVAVLVSKAQGIYCNNFEEQEESRTFFSYALEQYNDGGCFSARVKLEPGIYHFLFHVVEGENDFTTASKQTSPFYDRTYLPPGIEVNYIEVIPQITRQQKVSIFSKYSLVFTV